MARVQATSLRRIASLHNSAMKSRHSIEGTDAYLGSKDEDGVIFRFPKPMVVTRHNDHHSITQTSLS
ncbi:hypothetical protein ARMGADRAFT_1071050 [Armillaria gallica]|uniref:Uncharacterized protein n=1 Tax=Armillaria gallica TaxID=47427 RepID=A0A2H3F240_ARMGA|nr:hypothetical protein ARMGADRAFT_1071050 [Armillaria gallica]